MFLYDFWNAPFGVRIEHAHRLYGAAVGMATAAPGGLVPGLRAAAWMKGLGVLAVVAVIVQGVLGGTRVTQVSTLLAAVHGCRGAGVFRAHGRALCVLTGRGWQDRTAAPDRCRSSYDRCAVVVLGLVAAQIAAGELAAALWDAGRTVRSRGLGHGGLGQRSATFPCGSSGSGRGLAPARPLGAGVAAIASTLQIVLGIVAMVYLLPFDGTPRPVSFYQAVVRTGHQTNGALLLAATVVVNLRTFRHLCPLDVRRRDWQAKCDRPRRTGPQCDWEAVA